MSLSPVVRQVLAGLSADDLARRTDTELLARFVASHDEAAFAVLVERHGPAVLGVCRRMLGHLQDTEDAAQAVFLILARNARQVRKPEALAAWLHGVAVRVSRKATAGRRKSEPLRKSEATAESRDEGSWADARRVIDEALAALPESQRVPLVLCYLEGLTRDEAANRLGVPLDTFRGRLERGREKLRKGLAKRGFPLEAGLVAVLLESPAQAAPEWVNATAALATCTSSAPAVVSALATGFFQTKLSQYCLAGGVFATLALIGVVSAAATAPPPKAPAPVAAAEETIPFFPKDRTGVWRSVVVSEGKQVEEH